MLLLPMMQFGEEFWGASFPSVLRSFHYENLLTYHTCVQILALPLTRCVALGKLLNLSEPQLPQVDSGDDKT